MNEAKQFNGRNAQEIWGFCGFKCDSYGLKDAVFIHTPEGTVPATKGAWIIKDEAGFFWVSNRAER